MLYDKKGNILFKDETVTEKVIPIVYQYEDDLIKIENLKYIMNGNLKLPDIKLKKII